MIRAIAQSETIVRSRLTDRLSPDSPKSLLARSCASLHRHSCRRLIGRSAFQQQTFASISTGGSLSRCSARPFCRPSRPFSPSRHKFLSGPHAWRTRGSAIVEFEVPNSCLRRIRVDGLAVAPARQACLSLRGQSGLLTLHAATETLPDSTACTIMTFLMQFAFALNLLAMQHNRPFCRSDYFNSFTIRGRQSVVRSSTTRPTKADC